MPSLIPIVIPTGRLADGAQPVLPAGGGLVLRPWEPGDAAALFALYADPAIQEWHAYRLDTVDEACEMIARWQRYWLAETGAHWAVTRKGSGDLLGRMGLLSMALGRGAATCIYSTVPAARGHGVASRALQALCGWAFDEIGFRRIELRHSVANAASCRVAAKVGFAGEGTLRSVEQHADGWHDVHVHARVSGDPLPPA